MRFIYLNDGLLKTINEMGGEDVGETAWSLPYHNNTSKMKAPIRGTWF